jgi:hypothetical protein
MLPASYQVPAALVLLAGGLLAGFLGYRLFRIVLAIYGFVLGALVASALMGASDPLPMVAAALAGGVIGALILIVAYFIGVALIGAGIGALFVNLLWGQLGAEPNPWVVIVFAVLGAFGALALQRYVIIAGTAFGGAWTALWGAVTLAGGMAADAPRGHVWLPYPLQPAPGETWFIFAWLGLGVAGVLVQAFVTGRPRT